MVAYGKGVDFLLNDAKDRAGNAYRLKVQELSERGVQFKVCDITLKDRGIDPKHVIAESSVVPEAFLKSSGCKRKGT
ncbi:MAG: DsrE family protein [Burkholderiales bacterium]